MTTMIERVARALWAADKAPWEPAEFDGLAPEIQEQAHKVARSAIAAMREPTGGMTTAMSALITGEVEDYNVYLGRDDARTAWQLGIDAALEEKP